MPIINFPPSFDLDYYGKAYPELNIYRGNVLIEHYKKFAIEHGHSTCIYDRHDYLQSMLQNVLDQNTSLKVLEISPWDHPFLHGDNVKYFEVADAETLRKTSVQANRPFNNVPEKIDFVSPNGDLDIIDETFDIVVSVHVIEHCPDLVKHFQSVSRLLKAGGLYILVVPDKRYCFDYYHPESTINEVIDAFVAKRRFPRLSNVLNLILTATHNNAVLHWLGEHGERYGYRDSSFNSESKIEIMGEYFFDDGQGISREKVLNIIRKYIEALNTDHYISTHNWRFTPDSFGYIVNVLNALEFIDLSLYRLCHTIWGRFEFVTMLEKP